MTFTLSVVCFNNLEYTKKCIASVLANSTEYDGRYTLIVTDNASSDGTAEYLRHMAATLTCIQVVTSNENKGFIAPNVAIAQRLTSTYMVLLNNDAEVPPGWLTMLEAPFRQYPRAAISGPLGGCTSLTPNFHGKPGAFEYVEGSCLCVSTAFVQRYGLFSPYLSFAYGEDSDLSLRARQYGYTLHQVPFKLKHAREVTSKTVAPTVRHYREANHRALCATWAGYLKRRRFDGGIIVRRMAARGDVLLTTPIVRELHRKFPTQPLYVETKIPEIFANNPHVTHTPVPAQQRGACRIVDLDMAYENRPMTHIVDAFAMEAELGSVQKKTELYFRPGVLEAGAALLASLRAPKTRGVCAIHTGPTGWRGKDWFPDRWQAVLDALRRDGWDVVAVGTSNATVLRDAPRTLRSLRIHESAAVLAACDFFVGVDSFPMHLAQAVGTPVVGLFGTTLPQFIFTEGSRAIGVCPTADIRCAGERHRIMGATSAPCSGACMAAIGVDDVLSAVARITEVPK